MKILLLRRIRHKSTSLLAGQPPTRVKVERKFSSPGKSVEILNELRSLDTACLCDAYKSFLIRRNRKGIAHQENEGLRLLESKLRPINTGNRTTMVGVARTIQCTKPNDFLAVLRGLCEAEIDDVLVVNSLSSSRALAGELFCSEAKRKGVRGFLIDGPIRDTANLQYSEVRCFATSVSPYSGTIQFVGSMQQVVQCGGHEVRPGDIVVGDDDGVIVASASYFYR